MNATTRISVMLGWVKVGLALVHISHQDCGATIRAPVPGRCVPLTRGLCRHNKGATTAQQGTTGTTRHNKAQQWHNKAQQWHNTRHN
eukprot:scaffold94713_cov23-Cyclotella_meneghiniana.AAC.1